MMEYNIVWFEDSKDYVKSYADLLKDHLNNLGFILNLTVREDGSDFLKIIEAKDVDLLLIDRNLPDSKGEAIIEAARKDELYTEAIFYSGVEDASKINKDLEGVFYASRDNLLAKTKKIIELTIKKNLDVSNIRGLFIAETIDATSQMEEIISKILKLSGAEHEFFADSVVQEGFFTEIEKFKIIQRFLKQKIKSLDEKVKGSAEEASLTQLKRDLERVEEEFKNFQTDIIELRNELAHAKKTQGKKNTLTVKNKGRGCYEEKTFDDEKCRKTRESFIKHAQNLQELEKLLDRL